MNEPKLPCWMVCPSCGHREWCSEEDPDAGQGQMWNHIYWTHALKGRDHARARDAAVDLMVKVVTVQ